jgi:O-antigen/teichoic acid export membrane protein
MPLNSRKYLSDRSPRMIQDKSRSTRFLWAAGLGWGYQLFAMVVGLWLTKYLVGRLGDPTMGWWTHMLVMVGYITAIDLGLSALLPRDVAKETGSAGGWTKATDLPLVIGRWSKFALLQLPLAAIIAVTSVVIMARNDESNTMAAVCVMATALLLYPFRVGGLVVNGLQDFRYEGLVQIATYVASVTVTIVLSRFFEGPIAVIGGWATQLTLINSAMWTRLLMRYPSVLPSIEQIRMAVTPIGMLGTGIWAWMSGVGVTLTSTSEILAIGYFSKSTALFNYACTTKLIVVLTPLAMTIGSAMLPGLTELRCSGNTSAMERATVAYSEIILAISGFFGCLAVSMNPAFLEWWLPGDRYLGELVTWFAILGMHLRHIINSVAITMFSLSLEKPLWILNFLSGLVSVAVTFASVAMGGPRYAAVGPACVLAITIVAALYIVRKKAPKLVSHLAKSILIWFVAYGSAFAVCYCFIRPFAHPEWWGLMAVGLAAGVCYGLAILIPGLRSEAWGIVKRLPMFSFLKLS